jgi:two-component system cell cycle sensor histidine kinase/response regulator CckA
MGSLHAGRSVLRRTATHNDVELELRAALAMHQATLEAAAEGIVVTDERGCITSVNQRFFDMWRMPPEVSSSKEFKKWAEWGISQCLDPETGAANFRAATRSDRAHAAVITLRDGRVFERHSQPQVVDARVVGRVWCYRDLTEWVRGEEDRRKLEAQMQHGQKLESLGVLAGGIAHDFNNLLVGILGHAGIALTELPPDSPLYARVGEIQTAAQRAAELIDQILAYSGKGRFVPRRCDLSEIAGEMAALLRTAVGGAEMELHLSPHLPGVEGDPAQIRQIIMNLITNASDAIGGQSGRIVVTSGAMRVDSEYIASANIAGDVSAGEFVFVEVQDNGCGMDGSTVQRIFEPFFTTKSSGRGLGMAAVLGIVRRHHGMIKITTAPGQGTAFRVLLPAAAGASEAAAPAAGPPVVRAGARVLIVDDEVPVLRVAAEMLRRAGFSVQTAGGGEEAVALAAEAAGTFDAVLLDMTMPKMNGAETFRRLRALRPGIPVVLMSGYSSEEATSRFGVEGLAGFVQKPFLPIALVRTMTDAVHTGGSAPGTGS